MKSKRIVFFFLIALFFVIFVSLWITRRGATPQVQQDLLHVGTCADFPPFAFIDEQGIIRGFDIDLARAIAQRMEKELIVHDMPFFTLIPELNFGTLDFIIGGISKTEERARRVLFSDPYIEHVELIVITRKGDIIQSIDDLNGKKVIVNDGYTADLYMSDKEDVILERIPSVAESFIALKQGNAYAFVTAENTVGPFFAKYGTDDFNIYRIPLTDESYAIMVAQSRPELLAGLNESIQALKMDGTLRTLKQKWNLTDD